ncbi:MAG: sigma 54-interacting transcriptional regulator [Gammaproteobacteria bacterium]|nr:sigma 54-interacting transcriptional regulator [Gammaproteobacteria bacterium]MDH4315100.1 sigma 54-interacting transcriptional regulator [Gammaproteobacteria bacterium]MDH5214541.1 sigma 54-interacting transcriptional regulator [Gammaproteobacteria bacterium]
MANRPVPSKGKILLVDDDPGLLRLLSIRLRAEQYEVEAVESAENALAVLHRFRPDLVITDLRMDKMDGIALLKELQTRSPGLRVLIITAHGTIPDAVVATQSGAFGFLTKPIDKDELMSTVERAMKISGSAEVDDDWASEIITRNPAMKEILAQAKMVAATDARVLITGESGTGKELLAQAIHRASPRKNKPFVAINCSAMAENLLESELFGHEKGAFTGATRTHKGLFQAAEGGTLLLDEIGDMPMRLQVKLLRVLQEHQVRPVGSTEALRVDVRVISATHRNLQEMMREGKFREDLYYRLNVVGIRILVLDERREDIPLLVSHFLQQIAKEAGQERKVYAPEAVELLVTAEWPGNIRQLYNIVRQNVALSRSPVISGELVQSSLGEHGGKLASFSEARDEFTRNYLSQILQITMGNVSQAARLAKRNRTDFYKLLSRHELNPDSFKTR